MSKMTMAANVQPDAQFPSAAGTLWIAGVIPFEVAADLPEPERVHDAMKQVESLTPIRFQERGLEPDYLFFRQGGDSETAVGRRGGRQAVDVSPYASTGEVVHEICHALGLSHEHARPDRDRYVRLLQENVEPGRWTEFSRRNGPVIGDKPYDYGSIMHYPRGAYARADGLVTIEPIPVSGAPQPVGNPDHMGQRDRLSEYDVQTIRALYG